MTHGPAEIALHKRSIAEFPHYAEQCLKIRTKGGRIEPLVLNAVQQSIHGSIESQLSNTGQVRAIILKARQPGVSTYVCGRFYWRTTHQKGLKAYILTHLQDATEVLFAMTQRFHEHCPSELKPHTGKANAKTLYFDKLDSECRVGTAGSRAIGRGDTIQLFHGSEVAHWPNASEHMAGILQAVPNQPGTEIVFESTANGASGLFYDMCMAAAGGQGDYILIFVPWFSHDEYAAEPPAEWEMPAAWGDYGRSHGLGVERIYWAWQKNGDLAKACGGDLNEPSWLFRQEYPATVEEAFQRTGHDSYIRSDLVLAARKATLPDAPDPVPVVVGVDVAHAGKDRTRLLDRRGRRLGSLVNETFNDGDEMVIAGRLGRIIESIQPDMVFVDTTGGYGAGVVDRLRERGYTFVRGINFGSRAINPDLYANKRAEMWSNLRDWIADGADIPDDELLHAHICAPTARPDSSGRLRLEKKEEIRARLGFSPDGGDAAALTFAEPVRRHPMRGSGRQTADGGYDILGH